MCSTARRARRGRGRCASSRNTSRRTGGAPLDIETLAAVTGGSTRSIFKAFKEARGVSRWRSSSACGSRMRAASCKRLDENASVIDVASQCGFLNPGHFARDYRIAFGELPSETLRRSRRT